MTSPDGPAVFFRGERRPGHSTLRVAIPVDQPPPTDTRDPRYLTCVDHHLACDCREAERGEEIHEWRANFKQAQAVALEVCAGHPTWPDYYERSVTGWRAPGQPVEQFESSSACCQCTGCQIIRKAHL